MSPVPGKAAELLPPLPVAPTLEEWRAMSPGAREKFLVAANEALSDPLRTMGEGRPHKTRSLDMFVLGPSLALDDGTADLLARLTRMTDGLESRIEEASKQAEEAAKRAEEALKRIEQANARADRAAALAITARARGVLAVFKARGIDVPEAARDRILGERDPDRLDRWMEKAISAASVEEVLSDVG